MSQGNRRTDDKGKAGDSGIRVGVYGSLRKHLHNHGLLDGATFLGEAQIRNCMRMVSLGAFPAVIKCTPDMATPVTLEIYKVDDEILSLLDCLEGHPEWYKREKVMTRFKNVWVYMMEADAGYGDHIPVDSGDWLDFYTQKSA